MTREEYSEFFKDLSNGKILLGYIFPFDEAFYARAEDTELLFSVEEVSQVRAVIAKIVSVKPRYPPIQAMDGQTHGTHQSYTPFYIRRHGGAIASTSFVDCIRGVAQDVK